MKSYHARVAPVTIITYRSPVDKHFQCQYSVARFFVFFMDETLSIKAVALKELRVICF